MIKKRQEMRFKNDVVIEAWEKEIFVHLHPVVQREYPARSEVGQGKD